MALTPSIPVSQGQLEVVADAPPGDLRISQAQMLVVYNIPSEALEASQLELRATGTADMDFQVSQAQLLVVGKGRIANPFLRAWTFTLDGHDFYVLRLGDASTLVYDLTTEQWVNFADLGLNFWRPNVGMNWIGGTKHGQNYGSNVIAGDDTYGLIWFLDPTQPYDEHPDYLNPNQEIYFDRITMGQVAIRGREVMPCYAAWLTTDMGDPAYDGAGVQLEISDDAGVSFEDMGLITITLDENRPELAWYSLGQISAPGRLFRITDDGAIMRIDGMEMNDPDDDE